MSYSSGLARLPSFPHPFPCASLQKRTHRCSRLFSSPILRFTGERFENPSSLLPWAVHLSGSQKARPNVKSAEAGGRQNTEEQMLDEQSLKSDLEKAISDEDYALAAKLRNNLQVLHEDSKASVLSANARFYHAFRNGDLAAMHSIWAKEDHVYVVHPGAGRISGYELVIDSWEIVCGADHEFPIMIELKNVEVHVSGNVGYVTCMEVVKTKGSSWGKQVATNVFERIDGQWFMCIHHASHIEE